MSGTKNHNEELLEQAKKDAKKYLKRFFSSQHLTESDLEYKSLLRMFSKAYRYNGFTEFSKHLSDLDIRNFTAKIFNETPFDMKDSKVSAETCHYLMQLSCKDLIKELVMPQTASTENTIETLVGRQVLPLPIDRSLISGSDADRRNGGMGAWLTGDKRIEHYKRAVDRTKCEYDEDSVRMDWFIFSVCADDTVVLRSELGHERSGIKMTEFELIKDGKIYGKS